MTYPWQGRLLGALMFSSLSIPAAALDAKVSGIEGPAADNVANTLSGFDVSEYSRQRLQSEVARRTRDALKVYGYYEPELDIRLHGNERVEQAEIRIQPGPQVTIAELDIGVRNDAAQDSAFDELLANVPLHEGQPLQHDRYDSLRNRFSTLAVERGYFDADFSARRIEVRPWEQSARIYLTLDSGQRYRFGEVFYQGSQIEEARLRNMLPFEPGDPYLAGDLALYSQRLGDTGWFRSVGVRPRIQENVLSLFQAHRNWWEAAELHATAQPAAEVRRSVSVNDTRPATAQPSRPLLMASAVNTAARLGSSEPPRAPVEVDLVPADRHQFEVGVGYATDVGPRMRFAWDQPWINEDGDSLDHELYLSGPEQRFVGEYVMPLENPLRDSYELQYGVRTRDNEDTRTLEMSVEGARRWRFDNGWTQRLYLRTTYEDFTQADQEDQVLLLYPGISWARVRTRNPSFPSWGDRQRLSLEVSDAAWGSAASFVRTRLESQWIRMLGSHTRFVGRADIGAMSTDDFSQIPPSLRFFAGGDRSVRGYSYETLAPRNEGGELLGGQHLFAASLEGQRRITGDWWGAVFVDTGNAFEKWWPSDLATGAGLGIRWVSPVGPIRLDVAHPFDDDDDAWRLHFAIGPEF